MGAIVSIEGAEVFEGAVTLDGKDDFARYQIKDCQAMLDRMFQVKNINAPPIPVHAYLISKIEFMQVATDHATIVEGTFLSLPLDIFKKFQHAIPGVSEKRAGSVFFPHILAVLTLFCNAPVEDKLDFLFDIFDLNRSGSLSSDELYFLFQAVDWGLFVVNAIDSAASEGQLNQLSQRFFRELDSKKKGEITKQEFREWMQSDNLMYKLYTSFTQVGTAALRPRAPSLKFNHSLREQLQIASKLTPKGNDLPMLHGKKHHAVLSHPERTQHCKDATASHVIIKDLCRRLNMDFKQINHAFDAAFKSNEPHEALMELDAFVEFIMEHFVDDKSDVKEHELQTVFSIVKQDSDHRVSANEFMRLLIPFIDGSMEAKMSFFARHLPPYDRADKMCFTELKTVLDNHVKERSEMSMFLVEQIFALDEDESGTIDREEFLQMLNMTFSAEVFDCLCTCVKTSAGADSAVKQFLKLIHTFNCDVLLAMKRKFKSSNLTVINREQFTTTLLEAIGRTVGGPMIDLLELSITDMFRAFAGSDATAEVKRVFAELAILLDGNAKKKEKLGIIFDLLDNDGSGELSFHHLATFLRDAPHEIELLRGRVVESMAKLREDEDLLDVKLLLKRMHHKEDLMQLFAKVFCFELPRDASNEGQKVSLSERIKAMNHKSRLSQKIKADKSMAHFHLESSRQDLANLSDWDFAGPRPSARRSEYMSAEMLRRKTTCMDDSVHTRDRSKRRASVDYHTLPQMKSSLGVAKAKALERKKSTQRPPRPRASDKNWRRASVMSKPNSLAQSASSSGFELKKRHNSLPSVKPPQRS